MSKSLIGVVAIALSVALVQPGGTLAEIEGDSRVAQDETGNTTVGAQTSTGSGAGSSGGVPSASGPRPTCSYFSVEGPASSSAVDVTAPVEGSAYVLVCIYPDGRETRNVVIYDPANPAPDVVTPQQLAEEASSLLTLAAPEVHLNPDEDAFQLVGVATWMWLGDGSVPSRDAEASVPGLTVRATAQPARFVWDMGDGSPPIVCDGAGTPYDTGRPAAGQATDCRHVYQDAGTYTVTATTTWDVSWSASTGESGALASADRTSTHVIEVIESQAVVIDG